MRERCPLYFQKRTYSAYATGSAACPVIVVVVELRNKRTTDPRGFSISALQLESECSEDYHSPQSGHGLSDRNGFHVRVDGRVDLVRAVCGRADPFGN
jgi:hypothetical protein